MKILLAIITTILCLTSCSQPVKSTQAIKPEKDSVQRICDVYSNGSQCNCKEETFAEYIWKLALKPKCHMVHLYNGDLRSWQIPQERVVDIDVDSIGLQQCADALIRLYAEYLFANKEYDKIHFCLTNGFDMQYKRWAEGDRVIVKGNNTHWKMNAAEKDYSHSVFMDYLAIVFKYAGTYSLNKNLQPCNYGKNFAGKLKTGDILIRPADIRKGTLGHAIMFIQRRGDEFIFLQSFTPAQEIEVFSSKYVDFSYNANVMSVLGYDFQSQNIKHFP